MIKVAIMPEFFAWAGGLELLRNITVGLKAVKNEYNIETVVAVNNGFKNSKLFPVLLDCFKELHREEEFIYYESVSTDFADKLVAAEVDIVFPVNGDLGAGFPVPWTAYIADFQHKYMYNLFTEHECFYRETAFAARLRDAKVLVVNAKAVKQDIIKFYPWVNNSRIFSLPFSPIPLTSWIDTESEAVMEKYQVSGNYFMICNQFWLHKDHTTAFKAFASVTDKNAQLLCTGTLEDYRSPDYIQQLQSLLQSSGIADRVRFLGHIPKIDQISLLKNAIALVQPTLFEGGPGGGASYDAIALGVPVLLSDIAVNTEIESELARFFPAGDFKQLALLMEAVLRDAGVRPTNSQLTEQMIQTRQKLGRSLYQVIASTLQSYQNA